MMNSFQFFTQGLHFPKHQAATQSNKISKLTAQRPIIFYNYKVTKQRLSSEQPTYSLFGVQASSIDKPCNYEINPDRCYLFHTVFYAVKYYGNKSKNNEITLVRRLNTKIVTITVRCGEDLVIRVVLHAKGQTTQRPRNPIYNIQCGRMWSNRKLFQVYSKAC